MILTGQNIRQINTITHDGKVLVFGTALDGTIYYSIKRSGFEDSALKEGADPFGFEDWQRLRLGESEEDASVTAMEEETLADTTGTLLLRSVFGSQPEVMTSTDSPVQLVSALNHLYVFRQSPTGMLLVSRFVLDGMTNELLPKLEVRYRRSKQRFQPQESAASKGGENFDNLDYRDINGNSFFEPSLELSFLGNVANGWFAPLFVPTMESDRNRWHIVVFDATLGKLVLYTTGADDKGTFDLKDHLFAYTNPADPETTLYRSIPGIIRRTIELPGFTVAGCPSATTYDIQKEVITDAGPQLMRDTMRVMVAVPVTATGSTVVKTAVIDFALASDGTLSRIDATPDSSAILRSDVQEVITPVSLFDDIKEVASASPPPSGTVVATERGEEDQLQIRSNAALQPDLEPGTQVKLRGTRSYDGHYKVLSVDGKTFQVAASFLNNEAGFWEVVPEKQTGLVFDNMIVGTEKTSDGRLQITCPAHDLKVGDEVQIAGTRDYNGIFPITSLDADTQSFVLDAPFFTGEAANLTKVVRRGLRMSGADLVESPELEMLPPSPRRDLGRTLSVWVRVDAAGNVEQSVLKDSGQLMNLAIGSDNKVKLIVRMSDGAMRTVTDTSAIPVGTWTHYSGSVEYLTKQGGDTRIFLCRNGVEVATQTVKRQLPCHLDHQTVAFNGGGNVEVPNGGAMFARDFTAAAWVKMTGGNGTYRTVIGCFETGPKGFSITAHSNKNWACALGNPSGAWKIINTSAAIVEGEWVHLACTLRGTTGSFYVNGVLQGTIQCTYTAPNPTTPMRIGSLAADSNLFIGVISGVEVWNRAKSQNEIAQDMTKRMTGREPGLVGYWPLDNRTTKDISAGKRHGALKGNATWKKEAYLHPQLVPSAAPGAKLAKVMHFDGYDDYIEVPTFTLPTTAITVSMWARSATSLWNAAGCLIGKGAAFMFHPWPGEQRLSMGFAINGTGGTLISASAVVTPSNIKVWHLYTATFDGTVSRFYVDGVMVGETAAAGTLAQDAAALCIGHDWRSGPLERNLNGQLADVQIWNVARTQADIVADMNRRLIGNEPGLLGYWPLNDGPADVSPNKLGGSFKGNPTLITQGSSLVIGQGFCGEIAEAQVWSAARTAETVKTTMHLRLTGKEEALEVNYRLGAILFEKNGRIVPDFSWHGRDGSVSGEPFAGARRLGRATGSGMKVVSYRSDELCAVSQRGVYEETFEFKVTSSDPAFNPLNADGTGQKLFAFSYWGKSSRGSKEEVAFPAGHAEQADFVSLGGGWYKASCRVVIPDGISLMRAFGISNVQGRWGTESAAPTNEWTAMEVRKHRIRMISDAVTCDRYTDVTPLMSLPAQSQAVIDTLADVARAESKVARLDQECADLLVQIDVATSKEIYVKERDGLLAQIPTEQSAKDSVDTRLRNVLADEFSYWQKLRVRHSQLLATTINKNSPLAQSTNSGGDQQLFAFKALGDGKYNIYTKTPDQLITVPNDVYVLLWPISSTYSEPDRSTVALRQEWSLINADSGYRYIANTWAGVVWDIFGASYAAGNFLGLYRINGAYNQHWYLDKMPDLTPFASAEVQKLEKESADRGAKLQSLNNRLDDLNRLLADNTSVSTLQGLLATAQTNRTTARSELRAKNDAMKSALTRVPPATMPVLVTDDRGLATTGAVLDFAQPAGGVMLRESCEGNVLLSYFDTQGRMRITAYDAAADSRNAAFEQWVPDAVRTCVELSDELGRITLPQPIPLPINGSSCEAWVQYPLPSKATGPYPMSVVACSATKLDAPLAVRGGKRLGMLVDGWFFDSGVELDKTLAAGWHHLAASTTRSNTSFYADGVKLGSRKTVQSALRFNGTSDWIEIPAHTNPTTTVTISIWARSNTPTWNSTANLVSKRNAFIIHPDLNSKQIVFYAFIGSQWHPIRYAMSDIQGWHHYAGTFDGNALRFFVDGTLVGQMSVPGTINADGGIMNIANDDSAPAQHLFNGDVAAVAYWNKALSPYEIQEEYCQPLKGDEAGLIGYWRMEKTDAGSTSKIKDLTNKTGDGVVKGSPIDATITTLKDRTIGILGNGPSPSPIGRISDVRLWNIGLSDAEVAANARTAISGSEPGLIGYWPLDEATGTTAYDRSVGGQAHGTTERAGYAVCTANMGNPGTKVLNLPDTGSPYVECPTMPLAYKSFTLECWARRSGAGLGAAHQFVAGMGPGGTNCGFHFGFYSTNQFVMGFWGNDVLSALAYTDTDWHHWCGTFDQPTKMQRLYCDGILVGERKSSGDLAVSAGITIGQFAAAHGGPGWFRGDIAEVRIWDKARSATEIQQTMRRRLVGNEANLLAYYPLDEASVNAKVKDKKTGSWTGTVKGSAKMLSTTSLPISGSNLLVTSEYSAIELDGNGRKQALMRRFYAHATGGVVELLPEKRVEELTLQWVGNTQINPTLLGYIEGAPPIPSENLTVEEDYDGATTVTLTQSDETTYSWQRSETISQGFDLEGFVGGEWEVDAGVMIMSKTTSGKVGIGFNFSYEKSDSNESVISATSTLTASDSLTLTGMLEDGEACPAVGKRWLPKNVGYALVISGMADVFVTKLKRSGRMVSYDIRPVEGVPLDVNTITFMINPAYILNGSLDGMVGSMPADPTFYAQVPEMRAQYGSLYPASYYRLKEAYALKDAIERQDKERETFFYNTKADMVDQLDSSESSLEMPSAAPTNPPVSSKASQEDMDAMNAKNEEEKKVQKAESDKRQAEIAAKNKSLEGRTRAGAAFANWQQKMERLQTKAGKRNIVNTYVWDGDGGLRTEEQSFAGTIEHSIGTEMSIGGGGGLVAEVLIANLRTELSAVGSGSLTTANSKTLGLSKALELTVDLSGVEKKGITDLRDNPLVPGEKVDRYRFMSFYLEGNTNHFHDFFSYVVDPEWLMSNDEEARALRQTRGGKPNACWRVLHRVTYVERPALMAVGKETRSLKSEKEDEIKLGFKAVAKSIETLESNLTTQLTAIKSKLP